MGITTRLPEPHNLFRPTQWTTNMKVQDSEAHSAALPATQPELRAPGRPSMLQTTEASLQFAIHTHEAAQNASPQKTQPELRALSRPSHCGKRMGQASMYKVCPADCQEYIQAYATTPEVKSYTQDRTYKCSCPTRSNAAKPEARWQTSKTGACSLIVMRMKHSHTGCTTNHTALGKACYNQQSNNNTFTFSIPQVQLATAPRTPTDRPHTYTKEEDLVLSVCRTNCQQHLSQESNLESTRSFQHVPSNRTQIS